MKKSLFAALLVLLLGAAICIGIFIVQIVQEITGLQNEREAYYESSRSIEESLKEAESLALEESLKEAESLALEISSEETESLTLEASSEDAAGEDPSSMYGGDPELIGEMDESILASLQEALWEQGFDPVDFGLDPYKYTGSGRMILIGDSRFVFLSRLISLREEDIVIAKGAMYFTWFRDTAVPELRKILEEDQDYCVVINMGVNDCANNTAGWKAYFAEDYIEVINGLMTDYPNTRFVFASVGHLNGDYNAGNRILPMLSVNDMIDSFNLSLKLSGIEYWDVCEHLDEEGFSTADGVHFDAPTCAVIYDYLLQRMTYY